MKTYKVKFNLPFLYYDIKAESEEAAIEQAQQLALAEIQDSLVADLNFYDEEATELQQ